MGFEDAESGLIPRVDVGDLLGGDIVVVESVVASIHEARVDCEDLISSEHTTGSMYGEHPGAGRRLLDAMLGEEEAGSYNGASVVVADSNDRPPEDISDATVQRGWRCRGRVRLQLKRLLLDSKD
ncbi:uncharacterized protein [Triticum aestivum]|uniref:uncharacterized protein n=1 Tax=Triticum aestivum TaxID=4565 RepID=UPI001D0176EE|nr:uncharacterized protein LOC123130627 [Triticum aestivum]